MKIIYFDCSMGAAGDMLTAALLELHPNPDEFIKKLNNCGIPGVNVVVEKMTKCGILGTHVNVLLDGAPEHEHGHHHHHHHYEHMNVAEIDHIIGHISADENVKRDVSAVFNILALAESKVHGKPVDQIHFHEVGTMDAVADITAVCMLISELKPEKIYASPVNVGGGTVKCAHGVLPVPAPATAEILLGVPAYSGVVKSELCTPTGAALLKYFVNEFMDMPVMTVNKTGYGMGKKDFERPNCVRAFIGSAGDDNRAVVSMLSCNIDDMTGEELGYAVRRLLDDGALDVWTTPVYMKKNRPAYMLTCLCRKENEEETAKLIFKYTTTLGVRVSECSRYCLDREVYTRETSVGSVRVKKSSGYGVVREKIEYEDLARISVEKDISFSEARELLK